MVAFRVAEDSTGTSEGRWLDAFGRRRVPSLRLEPIWREAVVVSAHPDDDVLAVGDLLRALHHAGVPIRSVVVTDGERSAPESAFGSARALGRLRRAELRRAYDHLGIAPAIDWMAIADGEVSSNEPAIRSHLGQVIGRESLVLAPWHLDGHPDHDAVGRAAIDASTAAGATLWEFPVWAWHWADPETDQLPWTRAARWMCADPAAKRSAIECFATQVRPVEGMPDNGAVLPANVLERFDRPFEVVFT